MDPHSFFANPDPAVFLNADPNPASLWMRFRIQLKQIFEKLPDEECFVVEKDKKNSSKVFFLSWSKFTVKIVIKCQLSPISFNFSVFSLLFPLLDLDPEGKVNAVPVPQLWKYLYFFSFSLACCLSFSCYRYSIFLFYICCICPPLWLFFLLLLLVPQGPGLLETSRGKGEN